MARYIDAEELQEEIKSLSVMLGGNNVFKTAKESVLRIIDEQPTADVVEVKHGEWKQPSHSLYRVNCSLCGFEHYVGAFYQYKTNYCPNCGAKMDGGTG